MTDLLLILGLIGIAALFWQLRQMAEQAKQFATRECARQNVQLLSVAQSNARPAFGGTSGIGWKADYQFEFSTDGINQFVGSIAMHGLRITKINWPIFPEPEWHEAPTARGKIGGCGPKCGTSGGRCR
ncbi:DUF3301 domain-containing protein [Paraferrimonas sedimenticola]|uniref:DUF3301 domain-containing protein n=1 Tax=Paraferrimonas sedimenticola TaxID=375674 RepID=A0AA37VXH8_9GAMM|nr:DUF3301 domain-containing protein [Paraferrimonas sedimenticola]GLP96731.1 hypothetical protein GCM10007895_20370 [Paraferrimonas sedimenticola]